MEDCESKIEEEQSIFEDSIMRHQHLIHMFLVTLCRESRYIEDILNLRIFRLRMIHNFFQVCQPRTKDLVYDWSLTKTRLNI